MRPYFLHGVKPSSYWLLATGYWLLATGYWLLATGYWLLCNFLNYINMPLKTVKLVSQNVMADGHVPVLK